MDDTQRTSFATLPHREETYQSCRTEAVCWLERVLEQQASVVAFEKVFLIMGVTFFLALPFLLLFRTGRARAGGVAH